MDSMFVSSEKSILLNSGFHGKGLAYDGCFFYISYPDRKEIVALNKHFCFVKMFKTAKAYSYFCYDCCEKCFWAAEDKVCNLIYKLDCCFKETDCLSLPQNCCCANLNITGLSFDCEMQTVLVSFGSHIVSIDRNKCCAFLQKNDQNQNGGIVSISPFYIVTINCGKTQYICVVDKCGNIVFQASAPKECRIESIVFYPCAVTKREELHFYILCKKSNCEDFVIEWIFSSKCLGSELASCNYLLCDNCCDDEPCKPAEPGKNACNDIIESIALIEAALAHIINAEGEKLQKIIACSSDVDKILKANSSINNVIINITHLEIILHNKLFLAKELCNSDTDCGNNCDCGNYNNCGNNCDRDNYNNCHNSCDCENYEVNNCVENYLRTKSAAQEDCGDKDDGLCLFDKD